jgi:hypothetical protein
MLPAFSFSHQEDFKAFRSASVRCAQGRMRLLIIGRHDGEPVFSSCGRVMLARLPRDLHRSHLARLA